MNFNLSLKQLLVIGFLLLGITLNAKSPQEALKYMNEVSEPIAKLESDYWKYLRVMARNSNEKRVDKQRKSLIKKVNEYKSTIQSVTAYPEDDSYRLATLNYLDIVSKMLQDDYATLVDLEEIKERSFDDFEAYVMAQEAVNNKTQEAAQDLDDAQAEFAKNNDIKLIEKLSQTGQKIARANAALNHHNEINLLLIKCNFQQGSVFDAMERNDVNGMQQGLNTLSSYAKEGLEKIETITAYKGDSKLKYTGKKYLIYYQDAADKKLPQQVEFFLAQSEYEKASKRIESIKPRKRTKKDINDYNKQVNDFNKVLNDYNRTNEWMVQQQNKNSESWNKAVETFMNKHID